MCQVPSYSLYSAFSRSFVHSLAPFYLNHWPSSSSLLALTETKRTNRINSALVVGCIRAPVVGCQLPVASSNSSSSSSCPLPIALQFNLADLSESNFRFSQWPSGSPAAAFSSIMFSVFIALRMRPAVWFDMCSLHVCGHLGALFIN